MPADERLDRTRRRTHLHSVKPHAGRHGIAVRIPRGHPDGPFARVRRDAHRPLLSARQHDPLPALVEARIADTDLIRPGRQLAARDRGLTGWLPVDDHRQAQRRARHRQPREVRVQRPVQPQRRAPPCDVHNLLLREVAFLLHRDHRGPGRELAAARRSLADDPAIDDHDRTRRVGHEAHHRRGVRRRGPGIGRRLADTPLHTLARTRVRPHPREQPTARGRHPLLEVGQPGPAGRLSAKEGARHAVVRLEVHPQLVTELQDLTGHDVIGADLAAHLNLASAREAVHQLHAGGQQVLDALSRHHEERARRQGLTGVTAHPVGEVGDLGRAQARVVAQLQNGELHGAGLGDRNPGARQNKQDDRCQHIHGAQCRPRSCVWGRIRRVLRPTCRQPGHGSRDRVLRRPCPHGPRPPGGRTRSDSSSGGRHP